MRAPWGLQRWAWKGGAYQELPIPEAYAALLSADVLPAFAGRPETLRTFVEATTSTVKDTRLLVRLFGLHENEPKAAIRAAIVAAYEDLWVYADGYCDYVDAQRVSARRADAIDTAYAALMEAVEQGHELISRWQPWRDPLSAEDLRSLTKNKMDSLRCSLVDFVKARSEDWPLIRPDRFLYLRLAEIGAFDLCLPPRFYDSGERQSARRESDRRAPDQRFSRFLRDVLSTVPGWPVEGSRDHALKGLAQWFPEYAESLDSLAELANVLRGRPTTERELRRDTLPNLASLAALRTATMRTI